VVEPGLRVAPTRQDAGASLGCGEEFCVGARPVHTRVVRQGRTRLFRVDELRRAFYDVAKYAGCVGLSDRWTISI
jgi:hypothetical protein